MVCLLAVCHRYVGTHFPVGQGLAIGHHARQYPNRQQDFEDLAPLPPARMDQPTLTKKTASQPPVLHSRASREAQGIPHLLPQEPAQLCQDKALVNLQSSQPSQELECHPSLSGPFSLSSYLTKYQVCGSRISEPWAAPSALLPGLVQSSLSWDFRRGLLESLPDSRHRTLS